MFFIQEAHAQEAAAGQAGGGMIQLVMMVGLFALPISPKILFTEAI